jgi:archaeosine-15-forming tRNA-guanine transglycosylase
MTTVKFSEGQSMPSKLTEQEVKPRGYRVAQFCEAFQTSRSKAYQMMKTGELRYVNVAGRRFITNETADEFLNSGERGAER